MNSYNFSISEDLTQIVNLPTWIPDCGCHSPAFLDFFFVLTLVVVLQWLYFHWEILIMLLTQFPLIFQQTRNIVLFHHIAYDCSRADLDSAHNRLRDVSSEDIFTLSAFAAASEFCEWVQVEIDVYFPHCKYQVKPHLHGFLLLLLLQWSIKITFFVCTNRINLLKLKESLDRIVIIAKGFLKLLNLHMLIKQKSLSLSRNLALRAFRELIKVFSTKVNLL